MQYINRTYRRTGTLWDSRYKSSLIQTESYLLCCQRYIELNPVRAAIVADPVQYRWSSYRCHALGQTNAMLASRAEYLALGTSAQARQDAYRALFRDMLDQQAIASAREWVFRPGMRMGQPVPVLVTLEIGFTIR